jgi:hypothetical protein
MKSGRHFECGHGLETMMQEAKTPRCWEDAEPYQRHRPPHMIQGGEALFITGTTVKRFPHRDSPARRDDFCETLATTCDASDVRLVAWVVLKEHYLLVIAPEQAERFTGWIRRPHTRTSSKWNQEDGAVSRQVWYQHGTQPSGPRANSGAGSTTSITTRSSTDTCPLPLTGAGVACESRTLTGASLVPRSPSSSFGRRGSLLTMTSEPRAEFVCPISSGLRQSHGAKGENTGLGRDSFVPLLAHA